LKSLPLSPLNSGRLIHSGKFSFEAGDCDCLVEAYSGELINPRQMEADHAGQGNNFASKCVEAAAVYRIAPYEEREKFCSCYYCNKTYLFEG
jgi:hypothetical protein